jgi:hypothetical protein
VNLCLNYLRIELRAYLTESVCIRALSKPDFDLRMPLQTKLGAAQALRCGLGMVDDLIEAGKLRCIYIGRLPKVTTRSILALVEGEKNNPDAA